MVEKNHCIGKGITDVTIYYDDTCYATFTVKTPHSSRTDSHAEDYVVSSEDYDDKVTVSASVVNSILKATHSAISPIEIAILIAKVNLERCANQMACSKIPMEYSIPAENNLDDGKIESDNNSMHVIEEADIEKTIDEKINAFENDEEDFTPYDFLAEDKIATGLELLFLNSTVSFDDLFRCFSELTPQEVESILLAREPDEVLAKCWF